MAHTRKNVAIILVQSEKIVLIQATESSPLALPKGKVNVGETLYDCASDALTELFGFGYEQVSFSYIGRSLSIAGFFYGELRLLDKIQLQSSQGARMQLWDAAELAAGTKSADSGERFDPVVLQNADVIIGLLAGSLRPNTKLIRR